MASTMKDGCRSKGDCEFVGVIEFGISEEDIEEDG